jgi:hypothetical protein
MAPYPPYAFSCPTDVTGILRVHLRLRRILLARREAQPDGVFVKSVGTRGRALPVQHSARHQRDAWQHLCRGSRQQAHWRSARPALRNIYDHVAAPDRVRDAWPHHTL